MNKEKLFDFLNELNKLCNEYKIFIKEGDYVNPCPAIRFDNGNEEDEIYLTFNEKEKRYILWSNEFTLENGRVWFEIKKDVSFPKSDWSKGKIEGFSIMYEEDEEWISK